MGGGCQKAAESKAKTAQGSQEQYILCGDTGYNG